jgi:hypothetical protein
MNRSTLQEINKYKQGSRLVAFYLKNLVNLATTKLEPAVDKLAEVQQRQKT